MCYKLIYLPIKYYIMYNIFHIPAETITFNIYAVFVNSFSSLIICTGPASYATARVPDGGDDIHIG